MPSSPKRVQHNRKTLTPLSSEQVMALYEVQSEAIANFEGSIDELESALGMLMLGQHFGWKPLMLMRNRRTIRKYEEILGIDIKEAFPEVGPSADRSMAYKISKKFTNFWKLVSGDIKDDELKAHRRQVN